MARCAIQHNGLFGKVRPVAALKLRLVAAPLRAQPFAPWRVYQTPVMSCAPSPCACGMARAPSHTLSSHWPARYRLRRNRRGFCPGAARGPWSWPPPTLWGQALARLWPAPGGGPSAPQGGSLHPRRWGVVALASAVPVAGVGHGSLAHRRASNPNNLHGAARRAPAVAHQPHPSLLARVRQRCQAVKAKPQPFGLRCCAALTAWPRWRPCRS